MDISVDMGLNVDVDARGNAHVGVDVNIGAHVDVDVNIGAHVDVDVKIGAHVDVDVKIGAHVDVDVNVGVHVDVDVNVGALVVDTGADVCIELASCVLFVHAFTFGNGASTYLTGEVAGTSSNDVNDVVVLLKTLPLSISFSGRVLRSQRSLYDFSSLRLTVLTLLWLPRD